MAAFALKVALNPNPNPNGVVPHRRRAYSAGTIGISELSKTSKTNLPSSSPSSTNYGKTHATRPVCVSGSGRVNKSDNPTFDVVIVGAGIIGLTIARQFLLGSNLSVAVVDAAVPCAGATGAGQGYIWRVHKIPGSEKWELATRSHELWEDMAESIRNQGMDPLLELGWKKTGSMLVGRTAEECSVLRKKVEQLVDAGLGAEFLSCDDLLVEEPALKLGKESGAAFMPDDCQLDARRAVVFIEKANRYFAAEGRYAEFFYEPVTGLLRSESSGEVEAVQTSKNTLHSKKAVIIAAGSWSGSLMHDLLKDSEIELDLPVKPRKGHLLVLENFKSFQLNHGLMEMGYVNHESAALSSTTDSGTNYNANSASVSMTATMDMSGRLVFGSSRQLVGFDTEIDESVINRIWDRASEFFPVLKEVSLADLNKSREVRVGLRPYLPGGKPVIGAVPGLSKTYIAAGHEGEGLSLALGTAEMILNMVLENPQTVNPAPFSL
ncbi:FAD-dependent oxidoreductase family protein [Perilla frutescens var. frutescens]|nr:FAD-dependent oxidoreductase family protein [Perilla frutescens var. frutescens]